MSLVLRMSIADLTLVLWHGLSCVCDWQVLQKLGKADETKDAAFEEGVINFNKQYVSTVWRLALCGLFQIFLIINYSFDQFKECSWHKKGLYSSPELLAISLPCFFSKYKTYVQTKFCFVFHPKAEGSKLQRDLRAYLEAVKGVRNTNSSRNTYKPTIMHVQM